MAFGGGLEDNSEVMSEINMTPLVDVMLVLLIIFIITVPVITHSVKVDLPRVNNAPTETKPETIAVSVEADGKVYWDKVEVSAAELEQKMLEIAKREPQPEVHLHGDRKAEYEHVISVMAAAQRSGLTKIGFVTEPAK